MLLGLLCVSGLTLLAPHTASASNQSPVSDPNPSSAYALAMEELYPDERPDFEVFYRKLTPEGEAVFARLIGQLEAGQRGVLAHLLTQSPTEAANSFLAMYDGFDQQDFANATERLGYKEFTDWDPLITVLAIEHPDVVGAEFVAPVQDRCVSLPMPDAQGNFPDIGEMPSDIKWCSEAVTIFRGAYFPNTGYVTRGYALGANEARYQAQFSLFGPSTAAYKTPSARNEQRAQFGRTLQDWEINHTCGGVYIGDKFILTAAHCVVTSLSNERFFAGRRVRLGSHSIGSTAGLIPIRTAVTHMGYNSRTLENDIALLELEYVPRGIPLVGLPQNGEDSSGLVDLLLSGWGYIRPTESANNILALDGQFQEKAAPQLRGGRIQVFDASVCDLNRAFRRNGLRIGTGQICAGSRTGIDSCRGDSGGPLVDTRRNILIGLVSGGKGCGLFNAPSVYVDVAYYVGWIERARRAALRSADQTRRKVS